jgi:predicted PurR-regulated permease PerM
MTIMKRMGPRPQSDPEPKQPVESISSVTVIVAALALAVVFYLARSILLPFVLSGIVAYICNPLVKRVADWSGLPRWTAALAVLLLLAIPTGLAGYYGGPLLLHQLIAISGNLHASIQGFAGKLLDGSKPEIMGTSITPMAVADYVVGNLRDWLGQSGRLFTLTAIGFAGFFAGILFWVLLGYFLFDAPRIGRGLFWLVPPKYRGFAAQLCSDLDPILRRYFIGLALVVLYAATAAYIGLKLILGLPHAGLLALLTGCLEVIPIVGPIASAVVAGLVAVHVATTPWAIVDYVIYATLLRISIDEFFGPIVLGSAAYVRPVLVIFCFLMGGLLFGIVGMILAVPVVLTVKGALKLLYEDPAA